jgi:hypothetical protein
MKKKDVTASALERVDVRRRGFLGKLLAGGAAFAALPAMSTVVLGENNQQGGGKGKGGKGKGGKGKGGKGGRPDPARLAVELIKRFDKDGDKALNAKELAQALIAMRDRFRGGKGKGGFGGKGKGKGGSGGKGKGRGGSGGKGKGRGGKGKGNR